MEAAPAQTDTWGTVFVGTDPFLRGWRPHRSRLIERRKESTVDCFNRIQYPRLGPERGGVGHAATQKRSCAVGQAKKQVDRRFQVGRCAV